MQEGDLLGRLLLQIDEPVGLQQGAEPRHPAFGVGLVGVRDAVVAAADAKPIAHRRVHPGELAFAKREDLLAGDDADDLGTAHAAIPGLRAWAIAALRRVFSASGRWSQPWLDTR